jgi:mannosyl-oligosaccharide glucosidase
MKLAAFTVFYALITMAATIAATFEFDVEDSTGNSSFSEYQSLSHTSLLWGPYRSGLYFGIRPRIPRSLLSGLMWFNADDLSNVGEMRHFYQQGDNMKSSNWVRFDPRVGGKQIIVDNLCHITITIDYVKTQDGKSWGVKVKSHPHQGYHDVKTSFVWYSGLEGQDEGNNRVGYFGLKNEKSTTGYSENLVLAGISPGLGTFELEIDNGRPSKRATTGKLIHPQLDPLKTHHYSLNVPDDNVWKARDIFMTMLQESVKELAELTPNIQEFPVDQIVILRDMNNFKGNLHFVQNIHQGTSEFNIVFKSSETPESDQITLENIQHKIDFGLTEVDEKFDRHFALSAPFNESIEHKKFAQEMVSGLLGGLSYMYGDHLVDRETGLEDESFEEVELKGAFEGPHELFTLVPSRPFFPRGFYWDEGFHLIPLLNYDSDLVLDIVKSWFNLIDDDGWIAREQILGPELRSRVPQKFQVQSPQILNPPTLMLVFTYLLENINDGQQNIDMNEPVQLDDETSHLGGMLINNPELLVDYAREIYPKLNSHFELFRRSQKGIMDDFERGDIDEGYRWRGRTITHCLASGLDDYPRPLPADVAELNVDLLSWIGVMARSMKLLARLLELEEDYDRFGKIESDIIKNIEVLHWNDENTYCDLTVDDDDENLQVCHKGYISLFPFLTKMIPVDDHNKLAKIVELISDPEELWTDFGIRSLSKKDEFYRTEENYWRSPIWININYLILDGLKHYKESSILPQDVADKFASTYHHLRVNLVNNVFNQWKKTGYVWEQYDDESGDAKGAKNFLGWSSLVVLIMKMPQDI